MIARRTIPSWTGQAAEGVAAAPTIPAWTGSPGEALHAMATIPQWSGLLGASAPTQTIPSWTGLPPKAVGPSAPDRVSVGVSRPRYVPGLGAAA